MQFLVRWKGWSAAEDTWEPISNIQKGSEEALRDYLKKCGLCKQMIKIVSHRVINQELFYRVEWDDEEENYYETLEKEDNVAAELVISYWRGH